MATSWSSEPPRRRLEADWAISLGVALGLVGAAAIGPVTVATRRDAGGDLHAGLLVPAALLVCAGLLFVLRRRWVAAGVVGACAILPTGLAYLIPESTLGIWGAAGLIPAAVFAVLNVVIPDRLVVLAIILAAAGIVAFGPSVVEASPPLNFGTGEENAAIRRGYELLPLPLVLLAASGLILFRQGRRKEGVVVAASGSMPVALAYLFPETFFATLSIGVSAPAILIAVLLAGTTTYGQSRE